MQQRPEQPPAPAPANAAVAAEPKGHTLAMALYWAYVIGGHLERMEAERKAAAKAMAPYGQLGKKRK